MTWNPLMWTSLEQLRLEGKIPFQHSVCEIGNQTVNLTKEMLHLFNRKYSSDVQNGDSAQRAYKAMGFMKYSSLDINDRHGSIIVDLNLEVITEDMPKADLVTNNGTGEHIFNQLNVFESMHVVCRKGGLMIHVLPFVNWVNHCFYSYHPVLFSDLAKVNDYKICMLSIGNRWGYTQNIKELGEEEYEKQIKPRDSQSQLACAIKGVQAQETRVTKAEFPNVCVIAALKKTSDKPFRMPIQGKYSSDISLERHKGAY